MKTNFSTSDILRQLDQNTQQFTFPMLDNGYVYLADVRLTAFASPDFWTLIIETLGFSTRAGGVEGFSNALYCFGNNLLEPPGLSNNRFLFPISEDPLDPLLEEDYSEYIRESVQSIILRDHPHPVVTDPAFYAAKGIQLEEPPRLLAFELLRGLLPEHRLALLATPQELSLHFSPTLPQLLQLDEWRHPDLAMQELPSQMISFQMIAEVLVNQNSSLYHPSEPPNTHWRFWPEGGAL
jgi:hypothetical protein